MNSRRKDQCWQKHRDGIHCHSSVRHHADLPLHEFAFADRGICCRRRNEETADPLDRKITEYGAQTNSMRSKG
jgi:hypothetical protein